MSFISFFLLLLFPNLSYSATPILSTTLPLIQIHAVTGCIGGTQTHLDTMGLIGGVDFAALDLGVNLSCRSQECLFHVVGRLGRRFQEQQAVGIGEGLSLFGAHGSPVLQVVLVPDQEDDHVGLRVLLRLLQPPTEVLEGVAARDIVHQQRTCRPAVVAPRDGPERFLPGGIPDLQLDLCPIVLQGQQPRTEFHPDGQVVHRLEALVGELQQQTRLPDACAGDSDSCGQCHDGKGRKGKERNATNAHELVGKK